MNEKQKIIKLIRSCRGCGKTIDINNDLFYTMGYEPSRVDKIKKKKKQKIKFFHAPCWQAIAGDEWM